LPLFVMDSGDDAIHLAGNRSGVNGRNGADGIEVDADVTLLCACGNEADRAAATPRGLSGCRAGIALAQDEEKSCRKDKENNNPHEGPDTLVPGRRNGNKMFRVCRCARVLISRQVGDPLS
jgi:hypothetical protein